MDLGYPKYHAKTQRLSTQRLSCEVFIIIEQENLKNKGISHLTGNLRQVE